MATSRSGLGRGLGSLIPEEVDTEVLLERGEQIVQIVADRLMPNPQQPRTIFDKDALEELAASIRRHGVLQPLVVTREGKQYHIIAGERRWRAAQIAGLSSLPAVVRTLKQQEQLEVALIENVQRVDLGPLEQAISIERLHQQFNLAYSDIAKRLGKSDSAISNTIRLLALPSNAKKALEEGAIHEGHARQILALKDNPDKQNELLTLIKEQQLNVRQAERFVHSVKSGADTPSVKQRAVATENKETRMLGKRYNTSVKIYRTAKGGRLELYFNSEEDLRRLFRDLTC